MFEERKISIEFKNVDKSFKVYQNKSNSLKEKLINKALNRNKLLVSYYKVLSSVSFRIFEGETIGIIGENGTGKSTILKLISKIIYPDLGDIIVNGKVSSMIEIGAGFHPELTGRENVYLYGSILGIKRREIDKKFNDIVEFAEIYKHIDNPVKNYSSGMYVRLAFAVSVHLNPDILAIDEVLSVGDEKFQKKCTERIKGFKKDGKTIVFVSHDMDAVIDICDRVILIKKGGEIVIGDTKEIIDIYRENIDL